MGACPSIGSPRAGIDILRAREIGAARIEQGGFLLDQVEAVVGSLLVKVFPPPPAEAELDSPLYPFHFPDFDPKNPLTHAVSTAQRCAVRMLLGVEPQEGQSPALSGIESRRAREAQWDSFSWMRMCFDRALDDPELSYAHCSKEIWELLKRLYFCGKGGVIVDFYANNPSWRRDAEAQRQLRRFIREVVQPDLLAAKPIALELMVFAANPLSSSFRGVDDLLDVRGGQLEGRPIYSEELSYCLTSRLAGLGVPSAEEFLLESTLSYAEESGEWSRFDSVCKEIAKAGNSAAQEYFVDIIPEGLDHDSDNAEALGELEQRLNWLVEECPVTSCEFLAGVLELGGVGHLKINLSVEERLDLLKQRSSAGDELASSSLSRIYASNQIDGRLLNLSPLKRVEAIAELADHTNSYFVRGALTIIYNANRIGESSLFFSIEERYRLIEEIAQKGSALAAHIMLNAYLSDQLSLPGQVYHQSPSAMEIEGEREALRLNLTPQEKLEKLYALALTGYTPAIDAIFDYLHDHREEFSLEKGRPLLFELLMRRYEAKEAEQLLSLNENQIKIIDLLGSFHHALLGRRGDAFSF